MRCEECQGGGMVLIDWYGRITKDVLAAVRIIPCPGCGGCGMAHCCEGERPDLVATR